MSVCCECFVLSGRTFCDELITRFYICYDSLYSLVYTLSYYVTCVYHCYIIGALYIVTLTHDIVYTDVLDLHLTVYMALCTIE